MTSPLNDIDFYKADHRSQYPKGTSLVFSNLTARKSRVKDSNHVVFFGLQYFVYTHLKVKWDFEFFHKPKEEVVEKYRRRIEKSLGKDAITYDHIEKLHDLGYLPLAIYAVPEGTLVPIGVPSLVMWNTKPEFFWLTNYLETILSCTIWGPITSATTAFRYRKILESYAKKTSDIPEFVQFQAHDFSFRGMYSLEAATLSGAAHLTCFQGTDTIPAIDMLEDCYSAGYEDEFIGGSIPATEHSVMSMGGEDDEFETFRRLITEVYPKGMVSIVSDTWDFWEVLTTYLPLLKNKIMKRDGKVVIRPDSGDPVKIICGDPERGYDHMRKGAVEVLWDIFGGTINSKGYKQLDPHIGLIYGDSITPERCEEIMRRLEEKGFASTNVVLGVGSYTYQYVTRDTYGLAVKATYGEIEGEGRAIFKKPKTDDGTKHSARGLLAAQWYPNDIDAMSPQYHLHLDENVSWEDVKNCAFDEVFLDGECGPLQTLQEIRDRIDSEIEEQIG